MTLTLAASNQPFGCFVLDTLGVQVAALFFTSTVDSATGQTVAFAGDKSLGTITVDQVNHVASVTIDTSLATTPAGLACPLGSWKGNIGVNSNCAGQAVKGTIWVGKNADNAYVVNQTFNPTQIGRDGCGLHSFPATADSVTFGSNVLNYSFPDGGGSRDVRSGGTISIAATANEACDQLSVVITQTGCASCAGTTNPVTDCTHPARGEVGRATCTSSPFVFTKQ